MAIKSQSGREQERDRVNCERHRGDDTTEDFDLTKQLQALKQMNNDRDGDGDGDNDGDDQ